MGEVTTANNQAFYSGFHRVIKDNLSFYREVAEGALEALEFPHQKMEHWKYVPLRKLAQQKLQFGKADEIIDISAVQLSDQSERIVFVNGFFSAGLSRFNKEYIRLMSTLEMAELNDNKHIGTDYFPTMAAAFFNDGVCVEVKKSLEQPIEIIFIQQGENIFVPVRNHFRFEKNVSCIINISCSGKSSGLTNVYSTVELAENAQVEMNMLQLESSEMHHINFTGVRQQRDSVFSINTLSLGGKLIRNDVQISSDAEHTESNMNGLYLTKGDQLVDNHTIMDHRFPNCISNELYKGVMDNKSTAVFNGKVFVRRDAQKINAFQSNANILLSDDATINSKPELEIYADDVKCSHGSTTGQLDDEALFYLRARGIGEQEARKLLVTAFASDVMDKVKDDNMRERMELLVHDYFTND